MRTSTGSSSKLKSTDAGLLGNKNAVANLAVKNMDTARHFYEDVLGLKQVDAEGDEMIVFKSGNSTVNVYRSQYAGTNRATAVTWEVDDVEATARALKAKGITFEHYDMPDLTQKEDVYIASDMKVAWFKDPDGNILNIVSR
jgi:catechol 2,3-dioxygenase-like lactoylglutathione lyase family enzyme